MTPTLLYSLDTVPVSQHQLERIDAVQRKMVRAVVGWIGFNVPEESWEARGRRMKKGVERALALYPIQNWSNALQRRVSNIQANLHKAPHVTRDAIE